MMHKSFSDPAVDVAGEGYIRLTWVACCSAALTHACKGICTPQHKFDDNLRAAFLRHVTSLLALRVPQNKARDDTRAGTTVHDLTNASDCRPGGVRGVPDSAAPDCVAG